MRERERERERERFITSDIAFADKWTTGPTAKAKIHRLQKYNIYKLCIHIFEFVVFS